MKWMSRATLWSILAGMCSDFATVFHVICEIEDWNRRSHDHPRGRAESLSPGILGFVLLSLSALLTAVGPPPARRAKGVSHSRAGARAPRAECGPAPRRAPCRRRPRSARRRRPPSTASWVASTSAFFTAGSCVRASTSSRLGADERRAARRRPRCRGPRPSRRGTSPRGRRRAGPRAARGRSACAFSVSIGKRVGNLNGHVPVGRPAVHVLVVVALLRVAPRRRGGRRSGRWS